MRRFFTLLLIFVLFTPTMARKHGQELIDSLLLELPKMKEDTNKVTLLVQLTYHYYSTDPGKGIVYGNKALKLARDLNWKPGEAKALLNIGLSYYTKSDFDRTLDYFIKSLKIKEEIGDEKGISSALNNIGTIYWKLQNYDKALLYFRKSLARKEKINDVRGIANAINNIGAIYWQEKEYDSALVMFQRSMKKKEELRDYQGIANSMHNIGEIFSEKMNYIKAEEYFQKSIDFYKKDDDVRGIGITYGRLGNIYYKQTLDSITNLQKGKSQSLKLSKTQLLDKSIKYLLQALEYYEKVGEMYNNHQDVLILSKAYKAKGDFENSLKYFEKQVDLRDSVFNSETKTKIANLEAQRENDLKEKEIEYLKKENSLQKKITYFIAAMLVLVFVVLVVIMIFYRNKKRHSVVLESKNKIINDALLELESLNKDLAEKNQEISRSEGQLKELNATKDKFFSIIAHDLKNPLGSFRQISGLLIKEFDDLSKEDKIDFLTLMNQSAKQLYELLENLLNWARSQTGRLDYNPDRTNLAYLLENNKNLMTGPAASKNIELITDFESELFANIDSNMITTVIRNLVSNAIKFTPSGGKIFLNSSVKNNKIIIEINDTGVGIAAEDIDKLFRIDVQYSKPGTENEKGTGLGLILCKEFVEKNGGKIWVESQPGQGTSFKFTCPLAE